MTVFIEAQTDPYTAERNEMRDTYQARFRSEANVRRPTRGHLLKEDSYAIIRVMGADGNFIPVIDAAGEEVFEQDGKAYTTYYSNFFVQTVQEQRSEKQQIVDTFGETYIFFFGESPRFIQVQGMLLNTLDFNWRDEFWENYERYFRGTKLVERGARLYLIYDEIIVEGYMVQAQATESAENPWVIPFTFNMFVTGYTALSSIGEPTIPGYEEGGVYRGSGGAGYYDEGVQQWVDSSDADRAMADEAILGASNESGSTTSEAGDGRLMTDSLREGTASAGDPETSSYTQRAATATGEADRLEFRPNPRTGEGRWVQNSDEFVQRGLPPLSREGTRDISDDEWENAAGTFDEGLDSSVGPDDAGSLPDTTDSDYVDTMGRGGHATNEINDSGGSRLEGEGIRRDLGGSDLPNSSGSRARARQPQRDTPFGMTSQPGSLA